MKTISILGLACSNVGNAEDEMRTAEGLPLPISLGIGVKYINNSFKLGFHLSSNKIPGEPHF
jgi:hypothetical protein